MARILPGTLIFDNAINFRIHQVIVQIWKRDSEHDGNSIYIWKAFGKSTISHYEFYELKSSFSSGSLISISMYGNNLLPSIARNGLVSHSGVPSAFPHTSHTFTLAGFVLVYFLTFLNLTVSQGTMNGLIFYAKIVKANQEVFFPPGDTNTLTVFIAWLNLNLGIKTCFADGLNGYWKTWLQFVFPVYTWIITAIIIIASHYSSMVAKVFWEQCSSSFGHTVPAVLC